MQLTRFLVATVVVVSAAGVACLHCGGGDPPAIGDAGDAATDRRKDVGDGPFDVAPDVDESWLWPGWKRAPWFAAHCRIAIPVDIATNPGSVAWKACTNGLKDCLEALPPPREGASGLYGFRSLSASTKAGSPERLRVVIALSDAVMEVRVVDLPSFTSAAAWRTDYSGGCSSSGYAAVGGYSFDVSLGSNRRFYDFGDPARIMVAPAPTEIPKALQQKPAEVNSVYASATTVASRHNGPIVSRYPYGSTAFVTSPSTPQLNGFPIVVGDSVFAESNYGSTGWAEIYRVNKDGSVTLLRGTQGRQVTGFSTDGTTISWIEAHGNPSPSVQSQPTVEVWSAPFTDDPSTLSGTATKIATLPTPVVWAAATTTSGDLITTRHGTVGGGIVHVVRRSDGHVKLVSPGPSRFFDEVAYATNAEVVGDVNGDQPGQDGIALVRVGLGSW